MRLASSQTISCPTQYPCLDPCQGRYALMILPREDYAYMIPCPMNSHIYIYIYKYIYIYTYFHLAWRMSCLAVTIFFLLYGMLSFTGSQFSVATCIYDLRIQHPQYCVDYIFRYSIITFSYIFFCFKGINYSYGKIQHLCFSLANKIA